MLTMAPLRSAYWPRLMLVLVLVLPMDRYEVPMWSRATSVMLPALKPWSADASRPALLPTTIVGAVSQIAPESAVDAVPLRLRVESLAPATPVSKLPAVIVMADPDRAAPALASQA